VLARIIRRVPGGQLHHQQRPRCADDKRRMKIGAWLMHRAMPLASNHDAIKTFLPRSPQRDTGPFRPSRERHNDAHCSQEDQPSPRQQIDDAMPATTRREQSAASRPSHSVGQENSATTLLGDGYLEAVHVCARLHPLATREPSTCSLRRR